MKVAPATSLRVVIVCSYVQLIQASVLRHRDQHRGSSSVETNSRSPHFYTTVQPFAPVLNFSRLQEMIEKRRHMSQESESIRVENFYPVVEHAKLHSIRRQCSSTETVSTSDSSTEQWSKEKYHTSKSKGIHAKKHLLPSQSSNESDTDLGLEIPSLISPDARRIDIYKNDKFDSKKTTDYVRRFSAADKDFDTNGLKPRGHYPGVPVRHPMFQKEPRLSESEVDYLHLNRLINTDNTPLNRTTKMPFNKITLYAFSNFDDSNKKETSNMPKHNAVLSRLMSSQENFGKAHDCNENTNNTKLTSGYRLSLLENENENFMMLQSSNVKKQLSQIEKYIEKLNQKSYTIKNKKLKAISSSELNKRDIEEIEEISSAEWATVKTEKAEVISSVETHEIETKIAKQMNKQSELPATQTEKFIAKLNHEIKMSEIEKYQISKHDFITYKKLKSNQKSRLSEAKKVKYILGHESDTSETERSETITINVQLKQKLEVSPSQKLIVTETEKNLKTNRHTHASKSKKEIPVLKNLTKTLFYNKSVSKEKFNTNATFKRLVIKPEKGKPKLNGSSLKQKKENFRATQISELRNQKRHTLKAESSQREKINAVIPPNNDLLLSQIVTFNTTPNDYKPALPNEKFSSNKSNEQESLETGNRKLRLAKTKKLKPMPCLESHLPEKERVKPVLNNDLGMIGADKFTIVTSNTISAPHNYKSKLGAKLALNLTKIKNRDIHVPKIENVKSMSNYTLPDQKSNTLHTKSYRKLPMPEKEEVNAILNNELHEEGSDLYDSEVSSELQLPEKEILKEMSFPEVEEQEQENIILDAKSNHKLHVPEMKVKNISNVSQIVKFNTTPNIKTFASQTKKLTVT